MVRSASLDDEHERGPEDGGDVGLSVVHWGRFSGTVAGLGAALAPRVDAVYHDLTPLTRRPRLLARRALAMARRTGVDGPWYKSGIWSRGLQSHMLTHGWVSTDRPTLFLQTLAAPVLEPGFPYAIYTDRVGWEGAAVGGRYASTWRRDWINREEAFLRNARRVMVMGPSTADCLVKDYGLAADRVEVVGAGPGSPLGTIVPTDRAPRRLLFVGTHWEVKGGPEILEAFRTLRIRRPGLELTLVGAEPEEALPPGVRWLGRVPPGAMAGVMAAHDVFVVPTYMEALGYSLLEALMHGLPVVASDVGNQPWLVGCAGECVPPGDVGAVVGAVERILEGFDSFKADAVARAHELRASMTWERVADAVVAWQTGALGGGAR